MEFRVLGPLEVIEGGLPVRLSGGKQRALLAVLVLHANRVVPEDQLVEALWGFAPPETAATALHVYASKLREVLPEDALATRQPGYVLRVNPERVDLFRFERLTAEGRRALVAGDAVLSAAKLREALDLWRGPALAEFAAFPFAHAEIVRLEELRVAALEDRVAADLLLGLHAELVTELEALVGENPLRERLREQLMLALYRSGRQAEALAAYRNAQRTLLEELGLEPGPALRRLQRAILRNAPELELTSPARLRAATVVFAVMGPAGASDPAAVPELLDRFHDAAAERLREAGATVERSVAGVVLATFEGDPAGALQAALGARARLNELFGDDVRVRMAIEAGEVLTTGGSSSGPPVAAAAWLVGGAEPGDVLLGKRAAEAIQAGFDLRPRDGGYLLVGPR